MSIILHPLQLLHQDLQIRLDPPLPQYLTDLLSKNLVKRIDFWNILNKEPLALVRLLVPALPDGLGRSPSSLSFLGSIASSLTSTELTFLTT